MNKITIISVIVLLNACGTRGTKPDDATNVVQPAKPPVTITHISTGEMYIEKEFNAYTQYLKKEIIRAPISGYIESVFSNQGEMVREGEILLKLKTPEAKALAGINLQNDTLLNFKGTVDVRNPKDGIINTISYQKEAFVQQGDQLMDIIGINSIVFVMNVPFESVSDLSKGMKLKVILPGGKSVSTVVGNQLPVSNNNSNNLNVGPTQVQSFILHPDSVFFIPENLNMIVKVKAERKANVQRIARDAVLTNETQTSYWVMKLINDSTAVKTDIKKGLEEDSMVQIIEPSFSDKDRILLKGQYGLPDTAYVKVVYE